MTPKQEAGVREALTILLEDKRETIIGKYHPEVGIESVIRHRYNEVLNMLLPMKDDPVPEPYNIKEEL